jgi:hypothetical protein
MESIGCDAGCTFGYSIFSDDGTHLILIYYGDEVMKRNEGEVVDDVEKDKEIRDQILSTFRFTK